MTLLLAVTSSRSKNNYGTRVPVEFGPINTKVYFDITNIEAYDAILGIPFLWEYGLSRCSSLLRFWIRRRGEAEQQVDAI